MLWNAKNAEVSIGNTKMPCASFGHGSRIFIILPGLSDGLATVRGKALLLAKPYVPFFDRFTVYMFSRKDEMPSGYSICDMAADQAELDDGFCNVTYDISFDDGSESILKISAADRSGNTSNEINLMSAEVEAMKLVCDRHAAHVAEVQYYDTTREICSSDYFFMEKIQGDNYHAVKGQLPESTVEQINREIGEISRRLTKITNSEFGFLGDKRRYLSLYDYTKVMLENLLHDATRKNVDIVYQAKDFLNRLDRDKPAFDGIMPATLVHWDMWEGNVFVHNGHVSGIIDWERAMWGEAFMDDRFRYHSRNKSFLMGFGQTDFTGDEIKRIRW